MKRLARAHVALIMSVSIMATTNAMADEPSAVEQSVCGLLREPFTFWLWRHAAGRPNPDASRTVPNASSIKYKTKDGRLLRGYKLAGTAAGGAPLGSLLVAQGNAMLADQLLSELRTFAEAGIDVYIFDYRGYGNSEGKPRLKAIVSDYRELFDYVGTVAPGKRLLYGISFGGVVLLNVIGSDIVFDRAVIDSSPGYVSHLGCPHDYDPAENFPKNASGMLVIAGTQDTVVSPADSRALIDLAQARGGRAEVRAEYAHPFMDSDSRVHRERLEMIQTFLTGVSAR